MHRTCNELDKVIDRTGLPPNQVHIRICFLISYKFHAYRGTKENMMLRSNSQPHSIRSDISHTLTHPHHSSRVCRLHLAYSQYFRSIRLCTDRFLSGSRKNKIARDCDIYHVQSTQFLAGIETPCPDKAAQQQTR